MHHRESYFRQVTWRWSDVLVVIAPSIVIRLESVLAGLATSETVPRWIVLTVIAILITVNPGLRWMFTRWFGLAEAAFSQAWLGTLPLAIARHRLDRWPRLPRPRALFVESIWAILTAAIVMVSLSLLTPLFARLAGETEMPSHPLEPVAGSSERIERLAFTLLAILAAPLGEEIAFRGVFYNWLRQRMHFLWAVPAQALVFGLLHPFDLANAAIPAVVGLALALIYEWRKTLLAPLLLHAFVNGVALLTFTLGLTPYANSPVIGVVGETHKGGCRVTTVVPNSAADQAGLQLGDVITAVDGDPVTDFNRLVKIIRHKNVGDQVSIEFKRFGTPHRVDAILQRRGAAP